MLVRFMSAPPRAIPATLWSSACRAPPRSGRSISPTLYTYGTEWTAVNAVNYEDAISIESSEGYTNVTNLTTIPEPTVGVLAGLALGAGVMIRRRRCE